MAEVDAAEELQSYFIGFDDILQQLDSCTDNLATEYLERKLEDYVTILFGVIYQLEIGESAELRSELFALLKMLCEFGAVNISTSSPLNVHWTFRGGGG